MIVDRWDKSQTTIPYVDVSYLPAMLSFIVNRHAAVVRESLAIREKKDKQAVPGEMGGEALLLKDACCG